MGTDDHKAVPLWDIVQPRFSELVPGAVLFYNHHRNTAANNETRKFIDQETKRDQTGRQRGELAKSMSDSERAEGLLIY